MNGLLALVLFLFPVPDHPDGLFRKGMELAAQQRWEESRQALLAGRRMAPEDPRFPTELAGIAFKQNDLVRAKDWLRQALNLAPSDTYLLDFLGTVYFLEENLEACLLYWNRLDKPGIDSIKIQGMPSLDPAFLDHQFAFSPMSVLQLAELRLTRKRLEAMGSLAAQRFILSADPSGAFHLDFHSIEKGGLQSSLGRSAFSLARGLPFQTVYVDFYNLDGRSLNWNTLARWDPRKRRLKSELSDPLGDGTRWRLNLLFDARDEEWQLDSRFVQGNASPAFSLQRLEGGAGLGGVLNEKWEWETGAYLVDRQFSKAPGADIPAGLRLHSGLSLEYRTGIRLDWITDPERRLDVDLRGDLSSGKFFGSQGGRMGHLQAGMELNWVPQAKGRDWHVSGQLRAGRRFGFVSFDELFQLGLERDNPLSLRGHIGTTDGRKGRAPLGTEFVLLNTEVSRRVLGWGPLSLYLEPFLDAGWIKDRSELLGSQGWLLDAGLQTRFQVLESFSVVFSYGRDLRGGKDAFYVHLR